MSRCASFIFCPDCNRTHRCIYKQHEPQASHYWDSAKQLGHSFTWVAGWKPEIKLLGNVFLWLAQEELQVTISALKHRINCYPRVSKTWKFIDGILKKLEAQVRSPEQIALAKHVLKKLARRKDTPLARKRWANRLAADMVRMGEREYGGSTGPGDAKPGTRRGR